MAIGTKVMRRPERENSYLRAALKVSADANRVDIPAWMPEGEFFSYHCRAASPAR